MRERKNTKQSSPAEGGRFPVTSLSLLTRLQHTESSLRANANETLASLYWKPVYKYIRLQWKKSTEDAQDLTQSFFLQSFEKSFFEKYEPAKARFRTFVKMCVDRFIQNQDKALRTQKRGGTSLLVSLDFELAEKQITPEALRSEDTPDRIFEREWIRNLFEIAVNRFREHCAKNGKEIQYEIFELLDLGSATGDGISYKDLALRFGIEVTKVTNYLAWSRREFRNAVLDVLKESTSGEEEYRAEARLVLGIDV